MTTDADTNVEWASRIAQIRQRYEAALKAGETLDAIEVWLAQVPEQIRPQLKAELHRCHASANPSSIETRVLSSDAAIGHVLPGDFFSATDLTSESAVRGCRTFQGLSPEAVESLENELQPKSFPAGTKLLLQGEQARGLHLILSGSVDIVDTNTGERIDCDGAGSVLGEMSLLTGQPCSAEVMATSHVEALVLSNEGYAKLIAEHPELEIALSQLVSDRLGGRTHDALCGKKIGGYRMVRCINRGGMGVVYEALRSEDSQPVALKMLRHRFIYDDQMQSRFDMEAELLEGLEHPNIVAFRDHFLSYRTRFLVLDLCDGSDLFRLLQVHGPLDESIARAILGQIAEGLLYAHDARVIHRDLKPGNVLVDRQGIVQITDFGLSRLLEAEGLEGKAVGTPAYMPPEQFRSEESGPSCDWYAFGCLACELLTGRILFAGRNWMELYDQKRRSKPGRDWPCLDVSDELARVIHGALEPKQRHRRLDLQAVCRWARPVEELFP